MEQDNKSFVHDTIDLDEIKELLGEAEQLTLEEILSLEKGGEPQSAEEAETEPAEEEMLTEAVQEEAELAEEPAEKEQPSEEETVPAESEPQSEEVPGEKKKSGIFYELYSMLHDVIYLLAAVTLIFVFAVRLVGVQGDSMLPTLHNRDYLVLESNFLYGGDDLRYGDVVVLNVPHYQQTGEGPIVKRIIATQGQTVDIDFTTGAVYVDGVRLVEDYINAPTLHNWEGELGLQYPAVVPEGCIFVLGDNRNNSMDSRYAPIGMIDEQYVLGKVLFIALPGQTTDGAGNVTDPRDWGRLGLVS